MWPGCGRALGPGQLLVWLLAGEPWPMFAQRHISYERGTSGVAGCPPHGRFGATTLIPELNHENRALDPRTDGIACTGGILLQVEILTLRSTTNADENAELPTHRVRPALM